MGYLPGLMMPQEGALAKRFLDPNDPFFRPAPIRWATVLLPGAWCGVELWSGNPGWAVLFGGAAAWAFYELIWKGPDQG